MRVKSIRERLLWSLGAVTLAVFALAAGATFVLFRRALLQEYDALLAAKMRTLALLAEPEPDGVAFEFQEHRLADFTRAFEPEYYEAWDDRGKVLANSGHPSRLPQLSPGSIDEPRYRFITLPDGRPGRMIAVRFLPFAEEANPPRAGADWVTLVVARDTEQIDRAIWRLALMFGAVSTAAAAALLALLAGIVLRSLRPLDALACDIAAIGESNLATRVNLPAAPAEIVPVIEGFNELLQRIEAAFDRERAFSSNVAHELRTPLAGLLSTIQVALSRTRTDAEYRDALQRCQDISYQTRRLVETLLTLARFESAPLVTASPVALDELIDGQWRKVAPRAAEKSIDARLGNANGARVMDGDRWRIVLANLFDNAIEYTQSHGDIEVSWDVAASGPTLQVANGPCQLKPEDVAHVFEPFWRGDAARSLTGTHAGLGLPLTQRIVEALGGNVSAALEGDRFVVTIALPAARTGAPVKAAAAVPRPKPAVPETPTAP